MAIVGKDALYKKTGDESPVLCNACPGASAAYQEYPAFK